MFYLPLNHNLENTDCLVVGAGTTAARKLKWLLKAQANVRIVAPDVSAEIEAIADEIEIIREPFTEAHIKPNTRLIIAATDDPAVNQTVYEAALTRNILINTVDDPARCNVTFPAIIDREPILVSVSSSGSAPALARIIRGWIEEVLPQGIGRAAEWSKNKRQIVKDTFTSIESRVQFWDRVLTRSNVSTLAAGDTSAADKVFNQALKDDAAKGFVSLVGAGPGDPELITLKALRAIQSADVVLFDKLANPILLDYARRDAIFIDVGKQGPKPNERPDRPNNRGAQQSTINDTILKHAKAGQRVVRLKGGDPFIYGRGGEEIEQLARAEIDFEVIPGITASLGAASYAGIPLTHRDLSQSVRFVTGHRVENTINMDWPEFAKEGQTLVIYMGLVGLPVIRERLIEHGAPKSRPVAVIEYATLPEQRVIAGTLETIAAQVAKADVNGPSVLIIGEVVGLRTEPTSNLSA